MLDIEYLEKIKSAVHSYEESRRVIIRLSDDIRNSSKKAIFALHRDDMNGANQLLEVAEKKVNEVLVLTNDNQKLNEEGSFRAALEEMTEAILYRSFLQDKELGAVTIGEWEVPTDIFLGGLADTAGELQRRQVRLATDGDYDGVKKIRDAIEEIIGVMLDMDLTGYHRTKFDQTKNSFRRAEEILYDLAIRR
jgi:translin